MLKKHFGVIALLFSIVLLASPGLGWSASVSSKVFKQLSDIQEIMGEGKSEEAYQRLTALLGETEEASLDRALTLQTLGYVEMARENFKEAIVHLKRSLDLKVLPQNVVVNVGYMVAQLHAALGEFNEALDFAKTWYASLENPKPGESMFMANIYAQSKRYQEAIPYAEKAINDSPEPRETWLQLLTAVYFELEQYANAAKVLMRLQAGWPSKSAYWQQLASVYLLQKNQAAALAVLRLAFTQKVLQKEATVKSLVQLAVSQGVPEHAARLLEQAIAAELVPSNAETFEMLAIAYVAAKERSRAIEAYQRLSKLSDNGEAWVAISTIHVELGQWQQAEQALQKALKAKLESPGKVWLLLGIAQAEQKKFPQAKSALKKSIAFKETAKSASRWIKYTSDMQRQSEWLANAQQQGG